ncbi:MAG: hypothetical protein EOS22_04745 [Mesorhizobium sp.]|nr:MAG: hypothetical protein EOS22_04745 [Mesorhizobium sp.]TJW70753.1 MAG: hypothetical protein E5V29_03320 [Mesorhizobium sp.]
MHRRAAASLGTKADRKLQIDQPGLQERKREFVLCIDPPAVAVRDVALSEHQMRLIDPAPELWTKIELRQQAVGLGARTGFEIERSCL